MRRNLWTVLSLDSQKMTSKIECCDREVTSSTGDLLECTEEHQEESLDQCFNDVNIGGDTENFVLVNGASAHNSFSLILLSKFSKSNLFMANHKILCFTVFLALFSTSLQYEVFNFLSI